MKRNKLFSLLLIVTVLFSLPLTVSAAETGNFTDVPAGSWYEDAVRYVQEQGIMGSTTDATFSPSDTMTRGMLATVLYRTEGSPAATNSAGFMDVAAGQWYTPGVTWAADSGIISGYGNGTFGVNQPVTREQIATILWRYDGSPNAEKGTDFSDESSISAFAVTAVDWAQEAGIMNGRSGNLFAPKDSITRAEVASILFQYLSKKTPAAPETPATPSQNSKTLVVYFSMPETTNSNNMTTEEANSTVVIDGEVLGNTQYLAYLIKENTGADIFRIEPKTPYPTNHSTLVDLAKEEQNNNARPELLANVENLDQYDTIFVGYPNWWGDMPMILYTFFDTNDFSGKTIIPFNTHGGSGFSGTIGTIAQLEPNAMVDRTGFTVSRNDTHNAAPDVISWLDKLGY